MTNAVFPQTIFTTLRSFNNYGANDMCYGDISKERLKREFGLTNISNVVDPYTLTRLTTFDDPQSRFAGVYGGVHRGEKVSIQECARLLFEEMQVTSLPYSFVGEYKYLINQMIRHFQHSSGSPFFDAQLSAAYRDKLYSDYAAKKTKSVMQKTIDLFIYYDTRGFPQDRLNDLRSAIKGSLLPKFASIAVDKINGTGICVHDVYATRVDIISINVDKHGWKAQVKFTGQDHFGPDTDDIFKKKFNQFQFSRIWFVLQQYDKFGFRPFLTNMDVVIDIEGNR